MAKATSFWGLSINDNTVKDNGQPESTAFEVAITTLDDTNVVAQEALLTSLESAIDAIVIGVLAKATLTWERAQLSLDPAASTAAQRENKWLCRYHSDEVPATKFQVSIGTADLTKLPNHKEFLDLTTGVGAAFKTAFEAVVVSPDDPTVAVKLDSVQFVGRNT